jgi:bifunctional N-acetylglucosamine-1-phosphate-uridyltransferase/glucosamine-1-phosphate-acetyltransferase GlmU-like protein
MESVEKIQAISLLQANIRELGELVVLLGDDPILRAKTLARLIEQNNRLFMLENSL